MAVIIFFRKDIINFIDNKKLFFKIFVASIPVMIFGFFLVQMNLIDNLRNIKVIGWTTLLFGILLYFSDKFKLEKSIENARLAEKKEILGK